MTEEGEAMTFLANGLYTTASLQFLLALSGACHTWIGYARNITNSESVHLHSTNLVDDEVAVLFVANLCQGNGTGDGFGLGFGLGDGDGTGTDCGYGDGDGDGHGLGHGDSHGFGIGTGIGIGYGIGTGCGNGTARGTDVEIFIETLGWVGRVEAKQALVKLYEDLTRVYIPVKGMK